MVQRKKEGVRDAILAAAFQLFSEKGYSDTTVPEIARLAGISNANVYVYYASKMQILFALYDPWLEARLKKIDRSLKRISDPRQRMKKLLSALWRDLPKENNGFAHNIIEAIASGGNHDDYSPAMREFFVKRVAFWLQSGTSLDDQSCELVATVMIMAFDGFAANVSLKHGVTCDASMVELFSDLLLQAPASASHNRLSLNGAPIQENAGAENPSVQPD